MRKTVGILRTQENVYKCQHFGPSQLRMQGSQSLHYSVLPPGLTPHWTLSSPFPGACLIQYSPFQSHHTFFPCLPHLFPWAFELLTSVSRNSNNCLLYLSLNVLYEEPSLFQTKTEVSSSFLPSYYFLSFTKCLLGKLCKFGSNSQFIGANNSPDCLLLIYPRIFL